MNLILEYTTSESKIPSYKVNKTQKFGTQTLCADENLSTHFKLAFGIDCVRQCVCESDVHSCEWLTNQSEKMQTFRCLPLTLSGKRLGLKSFCDRHAIKNKVSANPELLSALTCPVSSGAAWWPYIELPTRSTAPHKHKLYSALQLPTYSSWEQVTRTYGFLNYILLYSFDEWILNAELNASGKHLWSTK